MKFHETNVLGIRSRTRVTRAYVHLDIAPNHLSLSGRPGNTEKAELVVKPRTELKDIAALRTSKILKRKTRWASLALCGGKPAVHLTALVGNWLTWSWRIMKLRSKKEYILREHLALPGLVPNGGISSKYFPFLPR